MNMKNILKSLLFIGVILFFSIPFCFGIGGWVRSVSIIHGGIFLCISLLIWSFIFLEYLLEYKKIIEDRDIEELKKYKANSQLFSSEDLRYREKILKNFRKIGIPLFSILYVLLLFGIKEKITFPTWTIINERSGIAASFMVIVIFLLFLITRYSQILSEEESLFKLRALAGMINLSRIYLLAGTGNLLLAKIGILNIDNILVVVAQWIVFIIALEIILNFILYFYSTIPLETRPYPFESRILSFITFPTDIFQSIASALDYQFGFKISQTWIYKFLEKYFLPIFFLQIVIGYFSTSLFIIHSYELGVVERFGKPLPYIYSAGIHLKYPWPIDIVKKVDMRIKDIKLGFIGKEKDIILWTRKHVDKELYFIVASKEIKEFTSDQIKTVPVNYLVATYDLHYRIVDPYKYLYTYQKPEELLETFAYREMVKLVCSVDFFDIMCFKRIRFAEDLKKKIQEELDKSNLGIEITFLGFSGMHPPVEVGKSFEDVVGSYEKKMAKILEAKAYYNKEVTLAKYTSKIEKIKAKALSYKSIMNAKGDSIRFQAQLKAYNISPDIFKIRYFMDTLKLSLRDTRKYIVPFRPKTKNITIINLEEKLQPDILDIGVEDLKKEENKNEKE